MKKSTVRKITAIAFIVFLVYFMAYLFIYTHERIHKTVFDYNGCSETSIEISWYLDGTTTCLDPGFASTKETRFLHSLNEVIGYNLVLLAILLFSAWFLKQIKAI